MRHSENRTVLQNFANISAISLDLRLFVTALNQNRVLTRTALSSFNTGGKKYCMGTCLILHYNVQYIPHKVSILFNVLFEINWLPIDWRILFKQTKSKDAKRKGRRGVKLRRAAPDSAEPSCAQSRTALSQAVHCPGQLWAKLYTVPDSAEPRRTLSR